jgi:nicotinate-nucleotide adenylyltransferase
MYPLEARWHERYQAALATLEDAATVVAVQRVVSDLDATAAPYARLLTEDDALHAARRVGLLAGSFNPLTLAHVAIAEAARARARLDAIVWAFAAVTVDKERVSRASVADRLAQMRSFMPNAPGSTLAVLNRGLYVEQANALCSRLHSAARVVIIVGYDKVVQIFDPRYYRDREAALRDLFAAADLLVAPREGAGEPDLAALLARPENLGYAPLVRFLPLASEYARDSSTEARALATDPGGAATALALKRLLTPEGAALALGPRPYTSATGEADPYSWRGRWVRALEAAPKQQLRAAPALSRLVALAMDTGAAGALARAWLADASRWDDARTLDRLLRLASATTRR